MKNLYIVSFLATLALMGCSSKEQTVSPKQPKATKVKVEAKSKAPSFEELKNDCLAGKGKACFSIAELFHEKGDYKTAKIFYRAALKQGEKLGYPGILLIKCKQENNGESCYLLGYNLNQGEDGLTQNSALALKYYQKAYNLGYTDAASSMANLYYNMKNYHQAIKWAQVSCQNESSYDVRMEACSNLGIMFDTGKGVRQDYQQAKKFYEKACAGNYARACTNLGYLYYNGLGVRQDIYKAQSLYGKGCDNGNQTGCDNYRKNNEQGRR